MYSHQYIDIGIALLVGGVLNWLIVSRIDLWGPSSKVVIHDIPVYRVNDGELMRSRSRNPSSPKSASKLPPAPIKYRRETDTIPLTIVEQRWQATIRGLITVGSLSVLNVGILWGLAHLGPISGSFKGSVKIAGKLSVSGVGVLGAFLVLFVVSVVLFRYVTER